MWPEHRSDRESAYLRLWRLNNETVEARCGGVLEKKEKGGGCHRGLKARPRCRGRGCVGGDRETVDDRRRK
ncbi:hypothetical protein OIU74_013581 [Salix koriyanagi]|uniref:Uncharacterized protein n=1 Tax=Salix koriyanagi TaxID=2511006 RepID=A0A9Q0QA98_9ROSI|nr:hypothetical protein OIU74_013581 [Salix koriyanagi]